MQVRVADQEAPDALAAALPTGDDQQSVARVEQVLASHLERFGARNELVVHRQSSSGADARRQG